MSGRSLIGIDHLPDMCQLLRALRRGRLAVLLDLDWELDEGSGSPISKHTYLLTPPGSRVLAGVNAITPARERQPRWPTLGRV